MSDHFGDRDELVCENEALRQRVAALEAEALRFKTTLYSIGDAVIATDGSGRVTQMNAIAEALTGWSEVDASGRPLPEVFRIVNEDTLTEVENPVERVLREGAAVGLANHTLLIGRHGTTYPIADSAAPIRNQDNGVTGVILVFRDRTEEHRAQAAICEAEERFRAFFDNAPIGKSMTAPDGRLLRVNRAFGDILGYSQEELQRIAFADITHPDDLAESQECVRAMLAGERDVWTMEKRYFARDGHVVWTHVVTRLQRDRHGQPLHLLTHVLDVSERKRAELALRESERRQRRLYDSGLFGVIFWHVDGRILDANDKFLQMIGYTREDLEQGRIDWVNMTPPEYRHLDLASVAELKATGVNRVPFDKVYLCKDGTRLPITIAGAMLDDERTNGVAFVLDITKRKRAETELAVRKTLLQNLLESSGDAIFSVDHQYCYTSFNSQHTAVMKALYGVDIELGRSLLDYQGTTEDHVQARLNITRALSGEHIVDEAFSGEDCRTRVYFEVSNHPIRDEADRIVGVSVFARDTTAKRRAEEELRQLNLQLDARVKERTAQLEASNQELDAFSYSVSHDLRTPLRAIDGFTKILADEYAIQLGTEAKRLCSVICENTSKMGQLIDELLTFSRLGRSALQPVPIDMMTLVQSVYTELTTVDSRSRIEFLMDSLPPAVADPTLIRQVWANLLSNAIKFSSKRQIPRISVEAEDIDGAPVYIVRDNGAGFDMQYEHKLFGVFQRLHSSREFDGTGVGLALVQRIVHRHGGRVWGNGKIDQGAAFYFTLAIQGDQS